MPLLDDAVIRELQKAALSAGLAQSRAALLAGIDRVLVAGLQSAASPAAQLPVDRHALNEAGVLPDGKVPLGIRLTNAAQFEEAERMQQDRQPACYHSCR